MGLGDAFAQNLGLIEKAKVIIIDKRDDTLKEASAATPTSLVTAGIGEKYHGARKVYELQFNPSSLRISGRGPAYVPLQDYTENKEKADTDKQTCMIQVSMQFVIDQEDNFDAFMADKMNLSLTQLGQNIAKGVMKVMDKNAPTVMDIAEGFAAALRNPATQEVHIAWGSLYYEGIMNNVNVQYTMFNLMGAPVRAVISLTLGYRSKEQYPNTLGPWEKAYKEAFTESSSYVNDVQKAGNLLNLG